MRQDIRAIIDKLSLEEKITLVTGADFFVSRAVERLDIPAFKMSDGPHGVRAQAEGAADHLGLHASAEATCFPSGAAMASGWDPEITAAVGAAIGEEAKAHGIRVMLGPAFNIKRSPLCGRDFEYYAEDPYLAGKLAAAYIRAMQSTGVAACPKHFAGNNQEDRRMVSNSVIDERALREIYLPAFEMAVKEGKPWSIMCAYNRLNGVFCSENGWLLDQVLRKEWGFDGAVISDWGAVSDRAKAVKAGMDLEMPGTGEFSDGILRKALTAGEVSEAELDACVEHILRLIQRTEAAVENRNDVLAEHHALARRAAEECLVLLKNEGHVLPLEKTRTLAVLGALAEHPRYQGGGSSHVASWQVDNTLECLRELADGEVLYAPGYDLTDGESVSDEYLVPAMELAGKADQVLVFVGLTEQYETEGADRADMKLPKAHDALVRQVLAVHPDAVVVLTAGAPVAMPWIEDVKALLSTYTAGDGLGSAAARILFGEVNPSGKLAETMPICLEHNPSYLNFRESKTDIRYAEGVFVGYRWYEKRKLSVLFPFGHGLSYTTFAYSHLTLDKQRMNETESLTVSVDVMNVGEVAGKEVVQLYVSDMETSVPRPVKELKGFTKIALEPGETKTVTFRLNRRAFAFYDTLDGDWAVESGEFEISVGASSADIRLRDIVTVEAAPWRPLETVTQETTFGELADDPRTYPLLCKYLRQSPMYHPEEMPDAPEFLRNLPLWTLNHMAGSEITKQMLLQYVAELNDVLRK